MGNRSSSRRGGSPDSSPPLARANPPHMFNWRGGEVTTQRIREAFDAACRNDGRMTLAEGIRVLREVAEQLDMPWGAYQERRVVEDVGKTRHEALTWEEWREVFREHNVGADLSRSMRVRLPPAPREPSEDVDTSWSPSASYDSSSEERTPSRWACPSCTYLNAARRATCEMCEVARPRPGAVAPPPPAPPAPPAPLLLDRFVELGFEENAVRETLERLGENATASEVATALQDDDEAVDWVDIESRFPGFQLEEVLAAMVHLKKEGGAARVSDDAVRARVMAMWSAEASEDLRASAHRTIPTCVVCMEAEIDTLVLPCKHMSLCADCSGDLSLCPMCRGPITTKINNIHITL